jgi:hypothetical protein
MGKSWETVTKKVLFFTVFFTFFIVFKNSDKKYFFSLFFDEATWRFIAKYSNVWEQSERETNLIVVRVI